MKRTFILTVKNGLDDITTEEIESLIAEILYENYDEIDAVNLEEEE